MFCIRIEYAAVLLFAMTQVSVFASVEYEKKNTEATIEMVASYFQLPWAEGIDWLANSTESPNRKEARSLIRGIESGAPWALKILDSLLEDQQSIRRKKNIQGLETRNQSTKSNSHEEIIMRDENCRLVSVGTDFNKSTDSNESPPSLWDTKDDSQNTAINSKMFSTAEIYTITLFLMIGATLFGCTICDFVVRNRPGNSFSTMNTLAKFSLYTNALALLRMKSTPNSIPAVDGIRCFCCLMVIIGHRFVMEKFIHGKESTLLDMININNSWAGLFLKMSLFAVDTFSLIAGFFVAYIFFKFKQSGKKLNVLTMYVYRYLRLTPSVAALMLIIVVSFHRLGNGPLWEASSAYVVDACTKNGWVNFFYVHNMVAPENMCLPHTWYLALDVQLFCLSPFILYPLHRSPKIGMSILGALIILSLVTPVISIVVGGYTTALLRFDRDMTWHAMKSFFHYVPTYNRGFPHLLGILLGYDLATKKRQLTRLNIIVNWFAACGLLLYCTWATSRSSTSNFAYDLKTEAVSAVLLPLSWSVAVAWVIYASTQGYGGLVTRFFSLPMFLPLSRLSYGIYLVHGAVQIITITPSQSPATFLNNDIFNCIYGDLVLSTTVAIVLYLFIECPVIVLSKMLLAYGTEPDPADVEKEAKKDL